MYLSIKYLNVRAPTVAIYYQCYNDTHAIRNTQTPIFQQTRIDIINILEYNIMVDTDTHSAVWNSPTYSFN